MTAAEWTTRTAWTGDLDDHPGAVALRRLRLEIDTERVYAALSVDASVASRASYGGTAPERVREQVAAARIALGMIE